MSRKLAICHQFQIGATVLGVNIVNFWKVCKMGQEEFYIYIDMHYGKTKLPKEVKGKSHIWREEKSSLHSSIMSALG